MKDSFQKVYGALKLHGLLLESDKYLPSVVGIVTGERLSGSWWSHKKGHKVFDVLGELADKDDVLLTKLISGKVTFIHKSLWLDFLTVATSHEPWQLDDLSEEAKALLKSVIKAGIIQTDELPKGMFSASRKVEYLVRELERKILVSSYQRHTDQGFHAKVIENWKHWKKRKRISFKKRISVREAERNLEGLTLELNSSFGGKGRLPWN